MDSVQVGRANATMPEHGIDQDDEDYIDGNYFFGGNPTKGGIQSRRSTLNSATQARQSLNQVEDLRNSSSTLGHEKQNEDLSDLKQLRMQNLTSLVNQPKRDTLLNKLGAVVKNKIDKKKNIHAKGYQ